MSMMSADSLAANEFNVELNGEVVNGVFRVSGFASYRLDEGGNSFRTPFRISKMVQRDGNNPFNSWIRETLDAKNSPDHRPTRTIAVVAIDDGLETRRWTVNGAWIQAIEYSDFDTGSFEMVEEIITIGYNDIDETWTATPDLQ